MNIGDDGFERIYRAYYGRVWRYYRMCRVSDDEAHDYAQDTFKRFYERRDQVRGDDAWPFLQAIARSVLLNKIRDQKAVKRRGQTVDIDDPDVPELSAPDQPDYAERQQEEMRRSWLYAAMAELSKGQQETVGLWLADFKLEEIARRQGISLDAVKSRLRDARRQLRARLGADALPEDDK